MTRGACLMLVVLLVGPAAETAPPKPRKASESDAEKEHRLAAELVRLRFHR